MRICLLCEGCYPYVVGGVSSWVQQLITNFPQYEFVVYAIGADIAQKGKFAYTLPENLVDVREVFLNDAFIDRLYLKEQQTLPKEWEIEEIRKLMLSNPEKWDVVFDFFQHGTYVVSSFLMSREFYDIVYEVYLKQYANTVFVDFLWTMRSMYLVLFHLLNYPPQAADVYHCVSTGYAGISAALGKHLHGGGLIITEHGIYTREREEEIIKADWVNESFKRLWIEHFKSLSAGVYEAADNVIALFETNSKIQIEQHADMEKCRVIANGINYKKFANVQGKTAEDEGWLNVGAVIRVSPIKDIKTMLYAFNIVKQRVPNARFFLMGPTDEAPEYYEECVSLLAELGTKDVVFTGRIAVLDYIGRMDVIVLTSISEGQPLSLMEAMAAGIPCVSTNVGCCTELLYGGSNDDIGAAGYLAPIMNEEEIADRIIRVITDDELKKKMGAAGQRRIIEHYSEEKFREAYTTLYGEFEEKFSKNKE